MSDEVDDAANATVGDNDNTSPSQLQEVTLDTDVTFATSIGNITPNGGPMRGRSVKDYEDQVTNLKKENFNLKLRIYFLEERMGTNFNLDKESAVKKNVELMVEVESLRKELEEKQDLLCQAVKAMELEEEEHKKESTQKDRKISEYQEQVDELLAKIQDLKLEYNEKRGDLETSNFLYPNAYNPQEVNSTDIVKQLQSRIEELQSQLAKERENSSTLENLLQLADCASIRCKSLDDEVQQKDKKINELHKEIHDFAKKVSSCNLRIQSLEDELSQTNSELQYKSHELQNVQHDLKNNLVEVEQLKKRCSQAQLLYESEQRKGEKLKAAVMARNSKVIELENLGETQKAKIRNLETRLESAQNEVKRKTDELAAVKSPVRRQKTSNTDDHSFSVQNSPAVSGTPNDKKSSPKASVVVKSRSPSVSSSRSPSKKIEKNGQVLHAADVEILVEENKRYREDITAQQQKILKLKSEQIKACQIIKSMINSRGISDKEINHLRKRIDELENTIASLKEGRDTRSDGDTSDSKSGVSLKAKVSEMKFTAITNPAAENEKTMAKAAGGGYLLTEHYKTRIADLEKQIVLLLETVQDKDLQLKRLNKYVEDLSNSIKSKDNQIVDLEFELLAANHSMSSGDRSPQSDNQDAEKSSNMWIAEIEKKNKEIERLDNELRKRTCDLQGVVNKELWEKNREIEKLQNRYENAVLTKEQEISKLEEIIAGKDLQLKVLKDEIRELGSHINLPSSLIRTALEVQVESNISDETKSVHEKLVSLLEERKHLLQQIDELKCKLINTPEREGLKEIKQLQIEYKDLEAELEKSEKLRSESNEICLVLGTRLEELAQFLNSLLKHKLVLGFLGIEQNSKLQYIVDQSLDLSQTLNTTLMLNPDQSLIQLSNISNLLDTSKRESLNLVDFFKVDEKLENNSVLSIVPSNATLTYQNHLIRTTNDEKQDITKDEVIKILRDEIENLKHEIALRDLEFEERTNSSKPLPNKSLTPSSATINNNVPEVNSESESWSEPDRVVSMARIGLHDGSLKSPNANVSKTYDSDSTEDEISRNITSHSSKKSTLSENSHQTILVLHKQVLELESKLHDKDKQILSEQLACIEVQKLLKISEENLYICTNDLKEAEEKNKQLCKTVHDLQQLKNELEEKLVDKDKHAQNMINVVEAEKEQALQAAKLAEGIAEKAKLAIMNAEKQIKWMESETEQKEKDAAARMKSAQKEFEDKIDAIEKNAETQIKKIKQSVEDMEIIYNRDYIKKSEVDKRVLEIGNIIKELESFKSLTKSTEDKLRLMEEKELELKQKLLSVESVYQEKLNNARKELDDATLQYSETVLEKTKIASEKAALEHQLKILDSREGELLKQVGDINDEFAGVKQAFQMQLANVENQKSKLEMKVSELESKNAELVNRLIKIQTGGDCVYLSASVPTSPSRCFELYSSSTSFHPLSEYRRQLSDSSRYAYASDGQAEENNRSDRSNYSLRIVQSPVDVERNQSNSSPDLGIESDHGRFSSLEANMNVMRPLQATLELTESMNNMLDNERNTCNNEQCNQKVKQMSNENVDLKKRLLRTRRALDETLTQLSLANQRKKQVEKTICKQIHKTSQVLRKAKANLDSGSETDVVKN